MLETRDISIIIVIVIIAMCFILPSSGTTANCAIGVCVCVCFYLVLRSSVVLGSSFCGGPCFHKHCEHNVEHKKSKWCHIILFYKERFQELISGYTYSESWRKESCFCNVPLCDCTARWFSYSSMRCDSVRVYKFIFIHNIFYVGL